MNTMPWHAMEFSAFYYVMRQKFCGISEIFLQNFWKFGADNLVPYIYILILWLQLLNKSAQKSCLIGTFGW